MLSLTNLFVDHIFVDHKIALLTVKKKNNMLHLDVHESIPTQLQKIEGKPLSLLYEEYIDM